MLTKDKRIPIRAVNTATIPLMPLRLDSRRHVCYKYINSILNLDQNIDITTTNVSESLGLSSVNIDSELVQ